MGDSRCWWPAGRLIACCCLAVVAWSPLGDDSQVTAAEGDAAVQAALERAGQNRAELERALDQIPADQAPGLRFLVVNMPDRDLRELKAEFLLENCDLAYRAWREAPWKDRVPEDVFFDAVLPYASINERRDSWRKDFADRFRPHLEGVESPSLAAARLNQKIFGQLNVKYSTGRPKADQSPFESMQAGLASCSGLAVLLVDACRAAGVPARFVGTPLWSDQSGNHSWVEVWDDGWHFTGAAEPSGDKLDQAWFSERASTAQRDNPSHAIYAVTFRRTPLTFPLVWDRNIDYVRAVNVTDRYVGKAEPLPEGSRRVMFSVLDEPSNRRVQTRIVVRNADGQQVFAGPSKDERFDTNDHLTATLVDDARYTIEVGVEPNQVKRELVVSADRPLVVLRITLDAIDKSGASVDALRRYLAMASDERPDLASQPMAREPLSRADAQTARRLLWDDLAGRLRRERVAEMKERELRDGDLKMPFAYKVFGQAPPTGRRLFISMHGGGGAPKEVNDQQWENQKILYEPAEGIYVAPRAPNDAWNMWHQEHIDRLFGRLIEDLVLFEGVDPNRAYLMGYSAGGDGVYQVAPRSADRWAAAAMMAGHPNEASPLGLRNLPFAIFVGGKDDAYGRNTVAQQWGDQLAKLRQADQQGYEHLLKVYPDKGHWMDRLDGESLPWMARFQRQPFPKQIVWRQDDVTSGRFYWLAVGRDQRKVGTEIRAKCEGQRIDVTASGVNKLTVRLADELLDLDQPVSITSGEKVLFAGKAARTIGAIAAALAERADLPTACYATIDVTLVAEPTEVRNEPAAPRKRPEVGYYPTAQDVVEKMLDLAQVTKSDHVCDLGCGDGRFVVTAAKKYGCRATGYELNPELVAKGQQLVRDAKLDAKARIVDQDIFTVDLSDVTVVTLFLLPDMNAKLVPQLNKMKPGSRIVTHEFDIPGIQAEQELKWDSKDDDSEHLIFTYKVPLEKKK